MNSITRFTLSPDAYLDDVDTDDIIIPEMGPTELSPKSLKAKKSAKKERKPGRYAEQSDEIRRIYWSITEVAKICDTSTSKIRFYDNLYNVCRRRSSNGKRQFTNSQVEVMKTLIKASEYLSHAGIAALIAGEISVSFNQKIGYDK